MGQNGRPGDQQRRQASSGEIYGAERNAIGKVLQPEVQPIPGDRPGDQVGNQDRDRELPQEQEDQVTGTRAEHLADADLPGAASGGESGQPDQAKAGDEDRNDDKDSIL